MQARRIKIQSSLIYFIVAIGFSWLFWIPATLMDGSILGSPWAILLYIGGVGPAIAGILLTYLERNRRTWEEYWQRAFDVRRIGVRWYLVILCAYPLVTIALTFMENGFIQFTESFINTLAQPVQIIPFILFIFVFGPFPEELGWRGYALDELQKRLSALWSSLFLGTVWALWHVPLFFMQGTYQFELGFNSPAFWRFMISIVAISVFYTWIYNNNRRSTLSAALFHFSVNFTGNIFEVSSNIELQRIILLFLIALAVVAFYGAKDLSRNSREELETA
jgi:membrane protease YdiL (CAAX protease family)